MSSLGSSLHQVWVVSSAVLFGIYRSVYLDRVSAVSNLLPGPFHSGWTLGIGHLQALLLNSAAASMLKLVPTPFVRLACVRPIGCASREH